MTQHDPDIEPTKDPGEILQILRSISLEAAEGDQTKIALLEKVLNQFEEQFDWIKTTLPEEYEGKTFGELGQFFKQIRPIFQETEDLANEQKQSAWEDRFRKIAAEKYGAKLEADSRTAPATVAAPHIEEDGKDTAEVIDLYVQEMIAGGNWRRRTLGENKASYQLFFDLVGNSKPFNQLTRPDLIQYKALLQKVPTNYRKMPQVKGMTISKIVATDHGLECLSTTSVNKHLGKISSLFKWATNHDYCTENVAEGLAIKQRRKSQEERYPFERNELLQIFDAIYTRHKLPHSYYFWLPLLAMYSGARINEISQLDVSDVGFEGDIHFLNITEDAEDTEDKHVKNANAIRKVPIHSELIRIGFLDYVEQTRKSKAVKLFASINKASDSYGTNPSKWFGRIKSKKLQLTQPKKKAFHSFRHGFIQALLDANVQESITAAIVGQFHPNITYGRYGKGSALKQLKENIELVDYELDQFKTLQWKDYRIVPRRNNRRK